MKIRIKIPEHLVGPMRAHEDRMQEFVDDVLLWGMEIDMNLTFYKFWREPGDNVWGSKNRWAVFSVETDNIFMFVLKWGACMHKKQEARISCAPREPRGVAPDC